MPALFRRKATNGNRPAKKVLRKDIQALRAFAVVAVILYHLWPERLIGGFTGVDIFFVISGYLMTISIMRHLAPLAEKHDITPRSILHLLSEFYARRIRRLVPAALTVLAGILTLSWLTGNLNVLLINAKNTITAATFWQNWYLANDSLNYLQQDNQIVATQHFWSLSLEEQFYLMWPLLLVISTLITTGVIIAWKKRNIPSVVLPVTLVTLVSIAYGIWLTNSEPTIAYYSTPARVWELMVGGIVALLPVIKSYDIKLLLPYLGLGTILYSIFFISGDGFPGWHALIPIIGTAMIIWGGTHKAESRLSFDTMFGWRPIQWIGNISYSLYLWHFPLIILLPVLVHRDLDGEHGKIFKLGIIGLTLILAQLSYRYVEQTTQRVRLKTRYIYLLFVVATGLIVAIGFGLKHHAEQYIATAIKDMHTVALNESSTCFGARAILHSDECGNPYGKMNQRYMAVGQSDYYLRSIDSSETCNKFKRNNLATKNTGNMCIVGDLSADKSIALFGDSHAEEYLNAFDYIGEKNHLKVYIMSYRGCDKSDDALKGPSCVARFNYIRNSKVFDKSMFVILSFLTRSYDRSVANIDNLRTMTSNKFFLLQDNAPTTKERFSNCYTLAIQCSLNKNASLGMTNKVLDKLISNKVLNSNQIIYTEDMYCNKVKCFSSIGGVPVYQTTTVSSPQPVQNSHITAAFSYSLGPLLEQKLRDAGALK